MTDKIGVTELQKVVADFLEKQAEKSFSQRHPELGKMKNCRICDRRHRSSQICHQRFIVELKPPEHMTELTPFQVFGKAAFAKKRIKPHYSKKRLQLLQKTIELYPLHDGLWPSTEEKSREMVTMQMARREAREFLECKRNEKRARLQDVQHRSRRVNRGLLEGNSRGCH